MLVCPLRASPQQIRMAGGPVPGDDKFDHSGLMKCPIEFSLCKGAIFLVIHNMWRDTASVCKYLSTPTNIYHSFRIPGYSCLNTL